MLTQTHLSGHNHWLVWVSCGSNHRVHPINGCDWTKIFIHTYIYTCFGSTWSGRAINWPFLFYCNLKHQPRWSDMDANQHVNNVKYIGWILEVLNSQIPLDELDFWFNLKMLLKCGPFSSFLRQIQSKTLNLYNPNFYDITWLDKGCVLSSGSIF